jgi:hypothetical protein
MFLAVAAGGKGNDDADGLCRIGLRENLRRAREERDQAEQAFGAFHRGSRTAEAYLNPARGA